MTRKYKSGQVTISVTVPMGQDVYRCKVKSPDGKAEVLVVPPVHMLKLVPIDSDESMRDAARAAISFAEDENGGGFADYCDHDGQQFVVKKSR